jgi:hypothetical protein
MTDGYYTGRKPRGVSLCTFLRDIGRIDVQSIRFRFDGGDFQKWIRNIIGDWELAQRIDELGSKVPEENLRQQLTNVVQKRISELQLTE